MPALLILGIAAIGLVLVVLTLVVAGIRQEPSAQQLTSQPPRRIPRLARRLLGVYVRRPEPSVIPVSSAGTEPGSKRSRSQTGRTHSGTNP